MARTITQIPDADRFSLWYRFSTLVVFNLLYLAGPAQLDRHNDPRSVVEKDYERRRDLHRARNGKPPLPPRPPSRNGGADPVVLCAVGGVGALVVLIVWALVAR